MCVAVQLWAKYQYCHLQSDLLPWSYVLNIDSNLVRLPEVVNPTLPSVRTLNVICTAEIVLFYTNHSATEGCFSVHISVHFSAHIFGYISEYISVHFSVHFSAHISGYISVHFCTVQVDDSYFIPHLQYKYGFSINWFVYIAIFMCVTFFIKKINSKISYLKQNLIIAVLCSSVPHSHIL